MYYWDRRSIPLKSTCGKNPMKNKLPSDVLTIAIHDKLADL